jgi:hypothetical protein
VILSNKQKRGGDIVRDPLCECMEDLIANWDLVDVKLVKGKYTWTNRGLGLDHIVAKFR